ncbi:MAG: DUF805 domain-containing protein [Bifidobacterium sp.]|nr:DUF805 domain-containing protein [Bifidobacterium sp.]
MNKPYYGIPFPEAIKRFFQKYVVFSGRASKSEFWWAFLGYFAVAIVLGMINSITGERMSWLGNLWALATILPGIAIFVRRLHDSGRSGWWAALPIGLGLLTIVFSVIAAVQLFATVGYAIASPAGLSGELAMRNVSGVAVWGLLIMVSVIAILVSFIVLGVAASKPEGARYDDDAKTQQGGYPGEYLQNPQPGQQPYSGQPYGQPYGQPAFGDQTPNVQERNAPYGQSANGQGNGYGNPTN